MRDSESASNMPQSMHDVVPRAGEKIVSDGSSTTPQPEAVQAPVQIVLGVEAAQAKPSTQSEPQDAVQPDVSDSTSWSSSSKTPRPTSLAQSELQFPSVPSQKPVTALPDHRTTGGDRDAVAEPKLVLCRRLVLDVYYTGDGFDPQPYDFYSGSRYAKVMYLNGLKITTMDSIGGELKLRRHGERATLSRTKNAILPKLDIPIVEDTFFGGIIYDAIKDDTGLDTVFFVNVYRIEGKLRHSFSIVELPRTDEVYRADIAAIIIKKIRTQNECPSMVEAAAARALISLEHSLFKKRQTCSVAFAQQRKAAAEAQATPQVTAQKRTAELQPAEQSQSKQKKSKVTTIPQAPPKTLTSSAKPIPSKSAIPPPKAQSAAKVAPAAVQVVAALPTAKATPADSHLAPLLSEFKVLLASLRECRDDRLQEDGQRLSYLNELKDGFAEKLTAQQEFLTQFASLVQRSEGDRSATLLAQLDRIRDLEREVQFHVNARQVAELRLQNTENMLRAANARAEAAATRHFLVPVEVDEGSIVHLSGLGGSHLLRGGFDTRYRVNWKYDRAVVATGEDLNIFVEEPAPAPATVQQGAAAAPQAPQAPQ